MSEIAKRIPFLGILISVLVLVFSATASAHVVVNPKQVLTAERNTFSVSVPNEHDTPVVAVRLVIPEGLTSVRPHAKPGWNIEVTKTGEGENISATEIKWTSAGASVPVDLKDDFLFSAKAPENAVDLKWKAYETYASGLVVGWDQEPSESDGNKPYSATKVVSDAGSNIVAENDSSQAVGDAEIMANRAMYVAVAGVLLGLVGVFLGTRKQ